ncbi:MAG: enoyl-CoA hydratase [Chloroflexi bacterium]|nr:enoyl-CoA hydratase [Chloroflexota bacterium]|tara:strand:- start:4861 stop:5724 length:864 start_codon:yes stop_codon:yes gene_type:complete
MSFEKIDSHTTSDRVLVLTMNDPETLNALGEPLMSELVSEVDRFASDPDLRALLITGAGRAFSSGANVRTFAQGVKEREEEVSSDSYEAPRISPWEQLDPIYHASETRNYGTGPDIVSKLHNMQKPSFAAVNGHAYGLGCGIALSCDFRVAGEAARFNEAFIRNGIVPADGSAWQLPKLVGMSNALWMQMSGEPITGEEAYRIGLANWLTTDDQLMDKTLELATKLARGPVYAMGIVKQLVHQGYQQSLVEHLPLASRAQGLTKDTFDHKEGVQAFIEKRQAEYRGY